VSAVNGKRRTARGHQHAEAFRLMWYGCQCGHRERIWNSRDGVTPFGTLCPSCDRPDLQHIWWNQDQYAPDHKPAFGQRVWIDMTRESAGSYVRARLKQMEAQGDKPQATFDQLVDNFFEHGTPPDMVVTGYARSDE
jgi:hypothetical protein